MWNIVKIVEYLLQYKTRNTYKVYKEKAFSQEVWLLVTPAKKNLEIKGKKAQRCLWHCSIKWIQLKSVRSICQDQPTALNQRGRIITCVFWAHKNMDKFTTCGFIQTPSSWFSFALNLQILKVNRSVSKCDCQAVCTWPYISSGDFSVQRICVNKSVPPGV